MRSLRVPARLSVVVASLLLASACARRPSAPPPVAVPRPSSTPAPSPSTSTSTSVSMTADDATQRLMEAETFEDVAIEYDGHLSDGVRAFRVVFAADDAAARFRAIREHGTLVGQLYAAIGLRHHDDAAYDEAVQALRARATERVRVQFGCLGGGETVGELLESAKRPVMRLAPGQTFEEWLRIHQTGHVDIVGGGFTSEFGRVASRRR